MAHLCTTLAAGALVLRRMDELGDEIARPVILPRRVREKWDRLAVQVRELLSGLEEEEACRLEQDRDAVTAGRELPTAAALGTD